MNTDDLMLALHTHLHGADCDNCPLIMNRGSGLGCTEILLSSLESYFMWRDTETYQPPDTVPLLVLIEEHGGRKWSRPRIAYYDTARDLWVLPEEDYLVLPAGKSHPFQVKYWMPMLSWPIEPEDAGEDTEEEEEED